MKTQTTIKAVKAKSDIIISINYGYAQSMLCHLDPVTYCYSRVDGWRCDNYEIIHAGKLVTISTGYSPVNGLHNFDVACEYEKTAAAICDNYYTHFSWEKKRDELNENLHAFISAVINA